MITLNTTIRTARKEHRCDFCGLAIPKGEKYENQVNIFDGDLYQWKSHLSCKYIAEELNLFEDTDNGLDSEGFQEGINSYLWGQDIGAKSWADRLNIAKEMIK